MKTTFLWLLLTLTTVGIKAQTIDKLIDQYSNNKNCEYVSIQKGLFNLTQWLGATDIDKDTKEVLSRIKTLKILTINLDPKTDMRRHFQTELNTLLKNGNFEKMMVTKNKDDHSTFYGSTDKNNNAELIIESQNDDQLSVIIMKGNLTHEDLEKIAK
ncbi:MAG: DUF4252 domain-containing protein [Microbacter sp.]